MINVNKMKYILHNYSIYIIYNIYHIHQIYIIYTYCIFEKMLNILITKLTLLHACGNCRPRYLVDNLDNSWTT